MIRFFDSRRTTMFGNRKIKLSSDRQKQEIELAGQILAGVVESGFLMAASDGVITEEEVEALARVIVEVTDGAASADDVNEILELCNSALEAEGYDARIAAVGALLPNDESKAVALTVAAHVLCCDDEYDPDTEGEVYFGLAEGMNVSHAAAKDILGDVMAMYS
jgi:hypothetical protein